MTTLYKKEKNKYIPVQEGNMYAPGVWLVSEDITGKRMIIKQDEIPEKFNNDYVTLLETSHEDLCSFIYYTKSLCSLKTYLSNSEDESGILLYPSNSDMADSILFFLSKTKKERENTLSKLKEEWTLYTENGKYRIQQKDGRTITILYPDSVTFVVPEDKRESLRKEYNNLEKLLSVWKKILQL